MHVQRLYKIWNRQEAWRNSRISPTQRTGKLSTTHLHLETNIDHYSDVIISAMASQITSLTIVYSTVYSGADQRKYQSFASLAFMRGIHRWPVNSLHKGSVTQKMFPFDDIIKCVFVFQVHLRSVSPTMIMSYMELLFAVFAICEGNWSVTGGFSW